MNKPLPYCLMPWIHLHVANKGTVKACCVANIPFGNINEQSLEEIWNGESIKILRDKFHNGEKDNRCAQCINLEKAGGKSIRQETFEKFPDFEIHHTAPALPIYFDIRFSNVCNFRCRTCWHGASSKWFADAKALGTNLGEKAIIKNVKDFDNFISKTGEALKQAEEFYFAGGEPLATEEHYLLLEWLIENKATQTRLRYNSNFSMLQFKNWDVLKLWSHFSEVEILASIDATNELGEYIRKDMDWQQFIANRKLLLPYPNIRFKISPTVSVLNMEHLPQLYKECFKLNLMEADDFYINILERPIHYNIQIFPAAKKEEIKNSYNDFFHSVSPLIPSIQQMLQECLDYMFEEDQSTYWNRFIKETKKLDRLRGESFHYIDNQ